MSSVEAIIASKVAMESLLAALFTSATVMLVEKGGLPDVTEILHGSLSIGAPVMTSALLLNYLTDKSTMPDMTFQLVRGVVGGAGAAALTMLIGEMPAKLDAGTITFAAVAGLSIVLADYIAEKVHKI